MANFFSDLWDKLTGEDPQASQGQPVETIPYDPAYPPQPVPPELQEVAMQKRQERAAEAANPYLQQPEDEGSGPIASFFKSIWDSFQTPEEERLKAQQEATRQAQADYEKEKLLRYSLEELAQTDEPNSPENQKRLRNIKEYYNIPDEPIQPVDFPTLLKAIAEENDKRLQLTKNATTLATRSQGFNLQPQSSQPASQSIDLTKPADPLVSTLPHDPTLKTRFLQTTQDEMNEQSLHFARSAASVDPERKFTQEIDQHTSNLRQAQQAILTQLKALPPERIKTTSTRNELTALLYEQDPISTAKQLQTVEDEIQWLESYIDKQSTKQLNQTLTQTPDTLQEAILGPFQAATQDYAQKYHKTFQNIDDLDPLKRIFNVLTLNQAHTAETRKFEKAIIQTNEKVSQGEELITPLSDPTDLLRQSERITDRNYNPIPFPLAKNTQDPEDPDNLFTRAVSRVLQLKDTIGRTNEDLASLAPNLTGAFLINPTVALTAPKALLKTIAANAPQGLLLFQQTKTLDGDFSPLSAQDIYANAAINTAIVAPFAHVAIQAGRKEATLWKSQKELRTALNDPARIESSPFKQQVIRDNLEAPEAVRNADPSFDNVPTDDEIKQGITKQVQAYRQAQARVLMELPETLYPTISTPSAKLSRRQIAINQAEQRKLKALQVQEWINDPTETSPLFELFSQSLDDPHKHDLARLLMQDVLTPSKFTTQKSSEIYDIVAKNYQDTPTTTITPETLEALKISDPAYSLTLAQRHQFLTDYQRLRNIIEEAETMVNPTTQKPRKSQAQFLRKSLLEANLTAQELTTEALRKQFLTPANKRFAETLEKNVRVTSQEMLAQDDIINRFKYAFPEFADQLPNANTIPTPGEAHKLVTDLLTETHNLTTQEAHQTIKALQNIGPQISKIVTDVQVLRKVLPAMRSLDARLARQQVDAAADFATKARRATQEVVDAPRLAPAAPTKDVETQDIFTALRNFDHQASHSRYLDSTRKIKPGFYGPKEVLRNAYQHLNNVFTSTIWNRRLQALAKRALKDPNTPQDRLPAIQKILDDAQKELAYRDDLSGLTLFSKENATKMKEQIKEAARIFATEEEFKEFSKALDATFKNASEAINNPADSLYYADVHADATNKFKAVLENKRDTLQGPKTPEEIQEALELEEELTYALIDEVIATKKQGKKGKQSPTKSAGKKGWRGDKAFKTNLDKITQVVADIPSEAGFVLPELETLAKTFPPATADDLTSDPTASFDLIAALREKAVELDLKSQLIDKFVTKTRAKSPPLTKVMDKLEPILNDIELKASTDALRPINLPVVPRVTTYLDRFHNDPLTRTFANVFSRYVHHAAQLVQEKALSEAYTFISKHKIQYIRTKKKDAETLQTAFDAARTTLRTGYDDRSIRRAARVMTDKLRNQFVPTKAVDRTPDFERSLSGQLTNYFAHILKQSRMLDEIAPNAMIERTKTLADGKTKAVYVYGGDVLRFDSDTALTDPLEILLHASTNSRKTIADGYLMGKFEHISAEDPIHGATFLKELGWEADDIKHFYEDITVPPVGWVTKHLLRPLRYPIGTALILGNQATLLAQDIPRVISEIDVLKRTLPFAGRTLDEELSLLHTLPSKTLPETRNVVRFTDDTQLEQQQLKDRVQELSLKRPLQSTKKLVDTIEGALPLDQFTHQASLQYYDYNFLHLLQRTPIQTVHQLKAAMESSDATVRAAAKQIFEQIDGAAYVRATGAVGTDTTNPLVRSEYSRWVATNFFNLWASRMFGTVSNRLIVPLQKVYNNPKDAKAIMENAMRDPQTQQLLAGWMNMRRFKHILDDRSEFNSPEFSSDEVDTFHFSQAQSSLLVGSMLYAWTKPFWAWFNESKGQAEMGKLIELDDSIALQAKMGAALSAMFSTLYGEIKTSASALYSSAVVAAHGDPNSSISQHFADVMGAGLSTYFGILFRDQDRKFVGNVDTADTARLASNRYTKALTDFFGTPMGNRQKQLVDALTNYLYAGKTADAGLLEKLGRQLLNVINFTDVETYGQKGINREINQRIREKYANDPNIKLIQEDPDLALQKGYIDPKRVIEWQSTNGKFTDEEEIRLAAALDMLDRPEFQYALGGHTSGNLVPTLGEFLANKQLSDFDKAMDSEQMKAFIGKTGSRSMAIRYLFHAINQDRVDAAKKAAAAQGQVLPAQAELQVKEDLLRQLSTLPNSKDSWLKEIIGSDKILEANLIADYAASHIGWEKLLPDFEATGTPETSGVNKTSKVFKIALALAIPHLRTDQYGYADGEASNSSAAQLLRSIVIPKGKEGDKVLGDFILGISGVIDQADVGVEMKASLQQGLMLGAWENLTRILNSVPGKVWQKSQLKNLTEVAKWVYDNGNEPYDTELWADIVNGTGKGGRGGRKAANKQRIRQLAKQAENFIKLAAKEDPNLAMDKLPDYNPLHQAIKQYAKTKLKTPTTSLPTADDLALPDLTVRPLTPILSRGIQSAAPAAARGKTATDKLSAPKRSTTSTKFLAKL